MTQDILERIMINAICNLDVNPLNNLSESFMYSNLTKGEIIDEFTFVFNSYKSQGVLKLTYERSICKHCYSDAEIFSFFDFISGSFITRYIIHFKFNKKCTVRLCDSSSLPLGKERAIF